MLKIEGSALQHFFDGQTLYVPKNNSTAQNINFEYEGENNKYIVMLFSHEEQSAMPNAQKPFLEKILNATKLSFKDVALVNINNYPKASLKDIQDFFAAASVFFWGISPAFFDLKAELYQPIIHDKLKIISVDAIDVIEKDKTLKAKLWGILQTHFLK